MAMVQKRVQVTIPPDVYDVCYKISELGGVSLGGLLGQMISENKQGLEMIAEALEAAKNQDHNQAVKKLRRSLLLADEKSEDLHQKMKQSQARKGEVGIDRLRSAVAGSPLD